jgi:hypothetical protein
VDLHQERVKPLAEKWLEKLRGLLRVGFMKLEVVPEIWIKEFIIGPR